MKNRQSVHTAGLMRVLILISLISVSTFAISASQRDNWILVPNAHAISSESFDPLRVHNLDTGLDYATIQAAIYAPETLEGHVIKVDDGVYVEDVDVSKAVTLAGESKAAVIQGSVNIKASKAVAQGFTINGTVTAGFPYSLTVFDVTIRDNLIRNGGVMISSGLGIPYPYCNITIADNHILNTTNGICTIFGRGNKIIGNTLTNNKVGILLSSSNNTVLNNKVESGGVGMYVDSFNNTLVNNVMNDNSWNFGFGKGGAHPNNIDTSNLINGRPIHMITNQSNIQVDPHSYPNPGYLALIGCENATVKDFALFGNGQGILLHGGNGNTLVNNDLVGNVVGVMVVSSNRNELKGNVVSHNGLGMWLIQSNLNTISNNEMQNNTRAIFGVAAGYMNPSIYGSLSYGFGWISGALALFYSANNTIVGNTLFDSDFGIFLAHSGDNQLRNNNIGGNIFNFAVDTWFSSGFVQDIDDSNTVDGKPIIYWVNEHARQVPTNAGYVTLVNCSDITISNLDISDNLHGILVVSSNGSIISNNRIENCSAGILIRQSARPILEVYPPGNTSVSFNTVIGCGVGIALYSGEKHTIDSNNLCANLAGIGIEGNSNGNFISNNMVTNSTQWSLDWRIRTDPRRAGSLDAWWWYSPVVFLGCVGISMDSSNNTLVENTVAHNEIGLAVGVRSRRGNNTIYHNNFINSTQYQVLAESKNIWDDGYPSGGNYYSDYEGVDANHDGIGDTPYVINQNNTDRYPLMNPIYKDLVPPNTFDDYDGSWHTQDFTITLTPTDDSSGIADTCYRINDGVTETISVNGQPLITTEGANNKLEYWSLDDAGNEETHHILTGIKLDKTAPTAKAGDDQIVNEDTLVTLDASASTDENGVATYTWTFTEGNLQTLSGESPTYTFTTPGTYTITLKVTDPAGNIAIDTVTVTVLTDTDRDGTPDNTDPDDDNDGTNDIEDAFPLDPMESMDTDGDGIGNNADQDDDNDGMPDTWETQNGLNPSNAADASQDLDGDGLTNLQEFEAGTDPNISNAQAFPTWIVGSAVAIAGIGVAAAILFLRRRK